MPSELRCRFSAKFVSAGQKCMILTEKNIVIKYPSVSDVISVRVIYVP